MGEVVAGTATEVAPTGKHRSESRAYPPESRWLVRDNLKTLQERWECTEHNYDDDTSHSWKEWRDIPVHFETPDSE